MSENPVEGELRFSLTSDDADFAWRTLWEVAEKAVEQGMTLEGIGLTKYPGAKI